MIVLTLKGGVAFASSLWIPNGSPGYLHLGTPIKVIGVECGYCDNRVSAGYACVRALALSPMTWPLSVASDRLTATAAVG